jgi:hypothetical protein
VELLTKREKLWLVCVGIVIELVLLVHIALAAEREANRWIPVSERLPECTLHVVACQTPFSPFVACYVPGEGTWYDDDGIELDFIPTHWRELPAPPQEAADDK